MVEEQGQAGGTLDWASDPLWHALRAMRIGPADAALTFEERLARENGWTELHALQVTEEYRRFLYLTARVREPMTPSVAVDQAWHLHLSYTRHYWDHLCAEILGRPLHHKATGGGPAEAERYRRQYERTLAAYLSVFRCEPPAWIWPDVETRFASRTCCVDLAEVWIVPRRIAVRAGNALLFGTMLTAYTVLNRAGLLDILMLFYVGFFLLVLLAIRRRHKRGRVGEVELEYNWLDAWGGNADGGCGGGCGGCGG